MTLPRRGTPCRLAGLVVLAAFAVVGCQGTGGQPGLADLRRTPGARASYPGATEYRRLEVEASANAMAKNPAQIKVDACAADPRGRVLAWFGKTLEEAGWSRDPGDTPVSDRREFRPEATAWSRGDRHFELRFLTAEFADHLAGEAGRRSGCPAAYETIVD
ncbi:hypothetical protein [Nocardioides panaciterrulae]|uniref:Uncharacterized protein n=1 Tax=Nocardioides panaciterrulae TaxID=661492 RepID=A0A7Y9E9A9_9ACTN|nr:hypothetical protein [Nocardioides panaciterrulae]NYD43594.1 hypothetical protein [Nocardioides panaciterrulae]